MTLHNSLTTTTTTTTLPCTCSTTCCTYKVPLDNALLEDASWNFLSKTRLKKRIRDFSPGALVVKVCKLLTVDGKLTGEFTTKHFNVLTDLEPLAVELANCADLHGIVKLWRGGIWVKETSDPDKLNIDAKTLGWIMKRMEDWRGKCAKSMAKKNAK